MGELAGLRLNGPLVEVFKVEDYRLADVGGQGTRAQMAPSLVLGSFVVGSRVDIVVIEDVVGRMMVFLQMHRMRM